ncbi:hypothetical protein OG455_37295 [Kitasatospora sp. NBC_01287]|uniref:hypothetical protein n=1 Tax=Kitasatospora sp. NBC_01287 TaxID=2903573 RepID=UPI00225BA75D|nr:hypothetical protein [Kitasatospora sp. NBC_01287]MCX4751097.1 hypothetical protein [Kitasatospora sp. NBC_01287]
MGLDITVVMADWEELARIPAGGRLEALTDAVHPYFCCVPCEDADHAVRGGWVWPRQSSWCAEYRFFGTTGSYSWHFQLANAWDDVRALAAPDLREALDCFLGGLVWEGPDDAAATGAGDDRPPAGGFPDDPAPWCPRVLLLRAPDEVPALVRAWEAAAPRLRELREPFDTEAAGWAGRPGSFDGTVALIREWGEVVTRAGARGWGLIGLPY